MKYKLRGFVRENEGIIRGDYRDLFVGADVIVVDEAGNEREARVTTRGVDGVCLVQFKD